MILSKIHSDCVSPAQAPDPPAELAARPATPALLLVSPAVLHPEVNVDKNVSSIYY